MNTKEQDAELVRRALAGSADAFAEIIEIHKCRIFTLILRLVPNQADAEDIAQEVFIKAYRRLDSYNPRYPLMTWLFKIAHNSALDFLRAKKPAAVSIDDEENPVEIADDARGPEEEVSALLAGETAQRLLNSLPPLYREALLLSYREELSGAQLAEVLGVPENTVKIRLLRARRMMCARLGELEKTQSVPAETLLAGTRSY